MALNLTKNEADIQRAASAIVDSSSTNWAVFGYEGHSNTLQVTAMGDTGLDDMAENLSIGSCMYAFCRVKDPKTTLFKYVLIIWQGEGCPDTRRGICSNHIRPVTALFKGISLTLTARTEEEVEPAVIADKVSKASSSKFDFDSNNRSISPPPGPVGSVYKKTVPSVEMSITKEREQFWQQQERDDGQRQHAAASQAKEVRANPSDKAQVIVPPKPARLVQAVADSKKSNYVDTERKKWEQSQTTGNTTSANRKPSLIEQRKASFGNNPSVPLSPGSKLPQKLAGGSGGFESKNPVKSSKVDEERRQREESSYSQSQRDNEMQEKERRLKAENMRQERLKEAQELISARASQEEPVMPNKTRTTSQSSVGTKPRTSSNSADDIGLKAYREEERRKFEQTQKESENDERERRLRGEGLRQERLRELASLTQKKDAASDDLFQSIGQSVKDKKQSTAKKNEDPAAVERRKEEQRRWEESQREAQAEEQQRKMRAETLRVERAQEAAALIHGRSTASQAKTIFEQQNEAPVAGGDTRSSANKVAKNLFDTAPIGKIVHHPTTSHHHNAEHSISGRDRKLLADEEERQKIETDRRFSHDSDEAMHAARSVSHDDFDRDSHEHGDSTMHDSRRDDFLPSPPPYSVHDEEEIDNLSDSFRYQVDVKKVNTASKQAGHGLPEQGKNKDAHAAVSAPAVSAWKAGLPVRPSSDDEGEGDQDDWNDQQTHTPRILSPHAGSSSGGSDHGGLRARALYDYQAADETEISFDPGDIITQIDQVDSGWYQGMAVNGTYGLFPANYVEMIS